MIWAIVLAAGESKRMGQPKMLLPFRSKTILETVIDTLLETSMGGIIVVLGAESATLSARLESYPVKIVRNPGYRSGMLSSVQAGFSALPKGVTAALLALGDQPAVSSGVIRQLHPEISMLSPNIGLRELMRRHPEAIREVAVGEAMILQDIDDPETYRQAIDDDQGQD